MGTEQEVDCPRPRDLEPLNRIAGVFHWTQKLFDPFAGEERPQPVPFIIVLYEESDIAVGSFVSGSPASNAPERRLDSLSEDGQIGRLLGVVGWLCAVDLRVLGGSDRDYALVAEHAVDLVAERPLRDQSGDVVVVYLRARLAWIVGGGEGLCVSRVSEIDRSIGHFKEGIKRTGQLCRKVDMHQR